MSKGFVKLIRGRTVEDAIENDPNAFLIATIIALRANWNKKINILGLSPGEALIGDYRKYGMSRQEYRGALLRLKKRGFVTSRVTNKGTIAKLADSRIYDINIEGQQPSEQPKSNHPATIQQPLTRSKERKKEENNGFSNSSDYKVKLFPIPGKNCHCGMPAVYKATGGTYDNFYCEEHMPEKVKAKYGHGVLQTVTD